MVRKRIMSHIKYINRHFYSITHAHIHSYTKHIMYSMLFFRKRKKREKWKDLCCYFITQILIALWKREPKRKVFSLFFLFTFYLRWIRLSDSLACLMWNIMSLAIMVVFRLFGNVTLVILKLNASTMGNLFTAGEKRASAHASA